MDIPVMVALGPFGFLSKSEVRNWPLIGSIATGLGTLYIERGRKDAAVDAAAAMSGRLAQGDKVLFFPEGTTGDGTRLLAFHPRLFQAAIDAGVPIQPMAISYHTPAGTLSPHAPFVNDDTLLQHLLRMAAVSSTQVKIQVGLPISVGDGGRNELAQNSRQHVVALLGGEPERVFDGDAVIKKRA
jgi:1-acyl-sn-glycerol-3-phosphate acyltransferase